MCSVRTVHVLAVVVSCLAAAGLMTPVFANHQAAAVIEQAASAELQKLARSGTVFDQEGDLLGEGDSGWTRMPAPAHLQETPPMCTDRVWIKWADAHLHMEAYIGGIFGVCYMLAGDERAGSNAAYAEGRSGS